MTASRRRERCCGEMMVLLRDETMLIEQDDRRELAVSVGRHHGHMHLQTRLELNRRMSVQVWVDMQILKSWCAIGVELCVLMRRLRW